MSGFLQLTFELGSIAAETAEECCYGCGATALTYLDGRDDPVLEPALGELRLWPITCLRALFPAETDSIELVQALSATLGISSAAITIQRIEDRAWEREWLRDFHAMRFGSRLWICPSHERVEQPGAEVIQLDPGLAFGTGTHPTTAMCLEWLDRHAVPGMTWIDFGCGSGILGIAAAKLRAKHVHCFDIDSQALLATLENARANAVAARVTIHQSSETLPSVDALLANILSASLCALAPQFAKLVRKNGRIILAGVLERDTPEVTRAYDAWFDIHPFENREGWIGLDGTRH
jgi:ribosomal protein L11 methyltransferase